MVLFSMVFQELHQTEVLDQIVKEQLKFRNSCMIFTYCRTEILVQD